MSEQTNLPPQGPPAGTPPSQGQPPFGGPPPVGGPAYGTPVPAPKKRGNRRLIVWIVGVVIALAVAGGAWLLSRNEPSNAKVGDCISGGSAQDMKIVGCSDTAAKYKVVGRVENKPQSEFTDDAKLAQNCSPFPTAETGFWQGEEGKNGIILCLEPKK